MNIPGAVALMAVATGVFVTIIAFTIARAPGWAHMRSVAIIAGAGAAFGLCDVFQFVSTSDPVAAWAARLSLLAASLNGLAWFDYMATLEERPLHSWERGLAAMVLCAGVLPLLGPLAMTGAVEHRTIAWLGATYADATTTALGDVCFAVFGIGVWLPLLRFAVRWRKGLPHAATHTLCLLALAVASINDALVAEHVYNGPYLLDLGFVSVAVAASVSLLRDFVASARRLETLSARLEHLVEERTQELMKANVALNRAEKLAAIGQLAAGVAHEINNPAAVVQGNLEYLRDALGDNGALPADSGVALGDALTALHRIAGIVKQLLHAGRVAGGQEGRVVSFQVSDVVTRSVDSVLAANNSDVAVKCEVPADLHALGQPDLLEQVLINLANSRHAIRETGRAGRILVRAERRDTRVWIAVTDDGPGIRAENRARLFEPFFTTRKVGHGTGLGLAVSLGLMRSQGGNLTLLETSPSGTTMAVDLPLGVKADVPALPSQTPALRAGVRVLLVDDDVAVLDAMERSLRSAYRVQTAEGVAAALSHIRARPDDFDAVVCDVGMPDGGGEGFYAELLKCRPQLGARTIFITGGAPVQAARRFLDEHSNRVLLKPLDAAKLRSMMARLVPHDGGTPPR
jgi:signal transduction histidine kinase/CheY-like chemotaxis protein